MSIKALLIKILTWIKSVVVWCSASGTSNGWYYKRYSDGRIEAWYSSSKTLSNYTTVGGFNAYSWGSISLPFTMANTNYKVDIDCQIGSGFAWDASVRRSTTALSSVFALASASGSQTMYLWIHIEGYIG